VPADGRYNQARSARASTLCRWSREMLSPQTLKFAQPHTLTFPTGRLVHPIQTILKSTLKKSYEKEKEKRKKGNGRDPWKMEDTKDPGKTLLEHCCWMSQGHMIAMDKQLNIPTEHSHTESHSMTILILTEFWKIRSGRKS
jgi:hypothetical protein